MSAILLWLTREDLPVGFEQVRVDSKFYSILRFQYHVGSRIIITLVICLIRDGSRHLAE